MPAPDRLLATLRRAVALARATPGRRGHTTDLPPCTDVAVAGDLHGHVGHFQTILKAAALADHPGRHLVLQELIHGTHHYPGGGDKSHQLVDLYAALKNQFPARVHYLPGNHELAEWTGRPVLKGDRDLNAAFADGVRAAYGAEYGPQIYQTYLELFKAGPVAIRTPNRVLVSHSLPSGRAIGLFDPARLLADEHDPADLQPGGAVHSVLWGRDTSAATCAEYLRKMDADLLVSGHIATDAGFAVPNDRQVIVDTAASPAGWVLVPADRPLTHAELVGGVRVI